MPFGPENPVNESEVSDWKIHRDPAASLKENILARSPGLVGVCSIGSF